jgi:hypothetical protein
MDDMKHLSLRPEAKTDEIKYLSLRLEKDIIVNYAGNEARVPLIFADGMIGAMAVFSTKEAAEAFVGPLCSIVQISFESEAREEKADPLAPKRRRKKNNGNQ